MKRQKKQFREILQRTKQKDGYRAIQRYHTIALGLFLIILVLLCAVFSVLPIRDFHVLAEFIAIGGLLVFLYTLWKIQHPLLLIGTIKDVKNNTTCGVLFTQYVVSTEKGTLIARDLKDRTYDKGSRVFVVSELTNYIAEQESENEKHAEKNS